MENSLEQKQTFLRENILEKGYDAEQFMGFLQSKKGEQGLDLNNWLIEELFTAVNEFISSNNRINNPQAPPAQGNEIPIDNDNFVLVNMNNQNNNEQSEEIIRNEKSTEVYLPCQKVEISELNQNKNVNIRLSFPEKVEGGIFSKSYVTYLIQTEPIGYKVRKRYSDFEWLRNILSTVYINCLIPPLCKKNYSGRFNEILIAKRTRSLEKFMKAILLHPILSNDPAFLDFISIENENDFEAKKKNYNKIQPPSFISEAKTLTGEVKVTLNHEKEIYFENIKDNADINEEILQKITKAYKALILLMQQVSEKMKEISDIWKTLYNKSIKYFESQNTYESYNIMSKLMNEWSELQKREMILLNNDVREYFRFIKNEFHSLKDLSLKVDTNKVVFNKAEERLNATKESLFKSQDINSWELNPNDMNNSSILLKDKNLAFSKMLPKETKKTNQLKNLYGFYINSVISEYERLRIFNGMRHKENVTLLIKSLGEAVNEFNVNLCDYLTYFEDLKDEEGNEKKGVENKNGDNGLKESLDS